MADDTSAPDPDSSSNGSVGDGAGLPDGFPHASRLERAGVTSLAKLRDIESLEELTGIGPAYAERLATADIETVDQLLAADAESLAERTDISEKRIRRWQENASDA